MAENKRITAEELAQIKERVEYVEGENWESQIVNELIEDDIPALIAEVEALQKSREWYDNELYRLYNRAAGYSDEIKRLQAKLEPLYVEGILSREDDEDDEN